MKTIKLTDLLAEQTYGKIKWTEQPNPPAGALASYYVKYVQGRDNQEDSIDELLRGLFTMTSKLRPGGEYSKYKTPEYAFVLVEDERLGALRRKNISRYSINIYNAGNITIKPGSRNLAKGIDSDAFVFSEQDVNVTKGDGKWADGSRPGEVSTKKSEPGQGVTQGATTGAKIGVTEPGQDVSKAAAAGAALGAVAQKAPDKTTNNTKQNILAVKESETIARNIIKASVGAGTDDDLFIAAIRRISSKEMYNVVNGYLARLTGNPNHDIEYFIKDEFQQVNDLTNKNLILQILKPIGVVRTNLPLNLGDDFSLTKTNSDIMKRQAAAGQKQQVNNLGNQLPGMKA